MAKFRSKPIEVEAVQWKGLGDLPDAIHGLDRLDEGTHKLCGQLWRIHGILEMQPEDPQDITVCPGDWIITDSDGRVTTCPSGKFEEAFEAV